MAVCQALLDHTGQGYAAVHCPGRYIHEFVACLVSTSWLMIEGNVQVHIIYDNNIQVP